MVRLMAARRRLGAAGSLLAFSLVASTSGCGSPAAPLGIVSEQSARTLLLPARFGWLSSAVPSGTLPSAIALGGKASGRVLLYFEFAEPEESRRLLRAELLLDASGAPGSSVDVELSRSDAAHSELRAWSDQPQALAPRVPARLVAQPSVQRLDVTEILRAERRPGEPLRLLLHAEPVAAEPVMLETGAAGGAQPRLEIYWE
jgi:hypothetical protein